MTLKGLTASKSCGLCWGDCMAYSNSDLVSYTNISPNKNSPRNHTIDTISIHCMATQWTAKQCCDYFAKSSTGAYSNYCVGKDGSIGLSVPENARSWCTSSASNDNRAITIEVATDSTHPYKCTSTAYNTLIELLVDICKRNNIKKLLWKGDRNLIGQTDKQNMTVHRWFKNKACPGDYLYNKHGEIAETVNARLGNDTGGDDLPTTDNASYIWNYFLERIGNKYGVAGLMGNLFAESGLKPNNLQDSYESKLGYTDEAYTNAVDSGAYSKTSFVNDSAGYGLAQWTYYSRKQGLYSMYQTMGFDSIGSIELACEYLWYELQSEFADVLEVLKNATSLRVASDKVLHDFESPLDQSTAVEEKRFDYATYYYNLFCDYNGTGGSDFEGGIDHDGNPYEKKKLSLLLMAMATEK